MFEHAFEYAGRTIWLVYSIERRGSERWRLVIDDVMAESLDVADAVPDWVIEAPAGEAAWEHGVAAYA